MRAIWSGSLAFGLINIPVKIYSASRERALKFKLLEKNDLCPISYLRVCRGTDKEVPYEDIVRGYEYQKGDYVVVTDDDFKKAAPKKTQTIEIDSFVDEAEIDPKYYDKPYYIEPDKKSEKAYVLLREALKRVKKVAIARFVLRDKEHICAVKPDGNVLLLHQLRFEDEIQSPKGLDIPEDASYSEKELDMALKLIETLEEHFKASAYKDTYTEELEKLIDAKAKGKLPKGVKSEYMPERTQMTDLMSALKKSLAEQKNKKK